MTKIADIISVGIENDEGGLCSIDADKIEKKLTAHILKIIGKDSQCHCWKCDWQNKLRAEQRARVKGGR